MTERPEMPTRAFAIVLLLAVGGCGGIVTDQTGSDAGVADASLDAWVAETSVGDASGGLTNDSGDAASSCPNAGSLGTSLAGRVPQNHRSSGSTCPQQRGASSPLPSCGCGHPEGGACPCAFCSSDSDCDAGVNGRCGNPAGAPFNYPGCSYDRCFSDSDCDAGVPCECRASASDNAPNYCVTGGNCRVDGDCGSGGYCSPSLLSAGICVCPGSSALCGDSGLTRCYAGSMEVPCSCGDSCGHAYYCHTACDQCVDDSDCDGGATCNYDVVNQRWDCETCGPVP
jgi:hypothetical protein